MPVKYNTDSFVAKLKDKFGDKLDYSKVIYNGGKHPVLVKCKIHGEFSCKARSLLYNARHGCPICAKENMSTALTKTEPNYIDVLRTRYGDKFDYSKVVYKNTRTKVTIICKEHGEFDFIPNKLPRLIHACPMCAHIEQGKKSKLGTAEFIKRASKRHGGFYSYEKSVYDDSSSPITITCPVHGDFEQVPTQHINGSGCAKCGREKAVENKFSTMFDSRKKKFIDTSTKKYNGKYLYSDFVKQKMPVEIFCTDCNEYFFETPYKHMTADAGCPKCSPPVGKTGYSNLKNGIFYIQVILLNSNIVGYKFGITNKSAEKRRRACSKNSIYEHEILFTINGPGPDIRSLENAVRQIPHKYFKKEYFPDGYTETISPAYISVLEDIIIEYASTGNFLDVKERCNQIKP